VLHVRLFYSPLALILVYPTFLVPFCSPWLLIVYFKVDPMSSMNCALVDGATRLQIPALRRSRCRVAVPGLISAGFFSFRLSLERFITRSAFLQSSATRPVPPWRSLTELLSGDVSQVAADVLSRLPCSLSVLVCSIYSRSSLTTCRR